MHIRPNVRPQWSRASDHEKETETASPRPVQVSSTDILAIPLIELNHHVLTCVMDFIPHGNPHKRAQQQIFVKPSSKLNRACFPIGAMQQRDSRCLTPSCIADGQGGGLHSNPFLPGNMN